jgi:trimethylamine---corrinoid protein Co-methyltransferase
MMKNKNTGGLYKPLSGDQIDKIHNAALTILEEVGITYTPDQDDLIGEMESAGANIDRDTSRIRFNRKLVEKALAHAPDRIVLYSGNGENDLDLHGDRVHFGNGGTTTTILDVQTGKCRPSSLDDLYQIARLVERLDNIDLFIRPCTPMELPIEDYDVNTCYAALKGTRKHVMMGIFDDKRVADVIDIAAIVAGGIEKLREKPIISFYTSFGLSPLQQSYRPTQILYEAVSNQIPISVSSVPMAGMTGPLPMAGTLTLTHAEVMAGLVMSQLINPGAPVMYGGLPSVADMHTANFACGAMEAGIMNAAIHQIARHIHIPNASTCGLSDSKAPDSQASWESGMLVLAAAMGGTNIIRHAAGGILEQGMTLSLEQIVMNDEIIGRARRVIQGIEVDDAHIGLDTIEKVGPGGSFLGTDQTFEYMRSEYYLGNGITNRDSMEKWVEAGSKNAATRAREMVNNLLSDKDELTIPSDVDRMIRQKYQIYLEP